LPKDRHVVPGDPPLGDLAVGHTEHRAEVELRPGARGRQRTNRPSLSAFMQDYIGEEASARPGRQYAMNADYFRRIYSMHYVLAHDDGQAQPGLAEADRLHTSPIRRRDHPRRPSPLSSA